VLYRLPELLASNETIYYVEGEKDVETLRSLGLTATTHAGGASSWRDELIQQVPAGRKVVVIPDADDPGRQLMRRVFAAARSRSLPVGFVLIPTVDGKQHKDVTEWAEAGLPIDQLLKEER
jgi:putative DNA primase/helicase